MSDFTFTPTEAERQEIEVPFIEDARADFAPYYRSRKGIGEAKLDLSQALIKLGAIVMGIQEGKFGTGSTARYGYQVYYVYHNARGVFRVAGLPIKGNHTKAKIEQVKVQALLNAADWWKSVLTQRVFSPGTDPLLMNLLVDGHRTVADYIREVGNLPKLLSDVVEGEYE